MKRIFAALILLSVPGLATDRAKVVDRMNEAATVIEEIMAAPDKGIPEEIFGGAKCVAVVPSLLKGGFVVGASYGKGVATCRTPSGWTAPALFRMEGGSFGLQIGGEAVDLIMVIMNDQGMERLLSSKFKLGADASAAAGPVGRHADATTDWKLRAQVLTYSRSRGAFAGITVNGSTIRQDKDDTRAFYGRMVRFRTSLTGAVQVPADAEKFVATVGKYAGGGVMQPTAPAKPAAGTTTEEKK
ncbi:MAG: lipid-binding SYLF domain-containing protein [Candidatus Koribacter versatilis]|uniref:Lipid-binding SYLF domain-containing protein n=1 Tax=Candidatus Korobacter versatilis TaxID=658062 RepID=A0A932A5P2_9BACT|nr:lipid-binding SYLF domain-containing protein [Candidatus Koribacter versatilis]